MISTVEKRVVTSSLALPEELDRRLVVERVKAWVIVLLETDFKEDPMAEELPMTSLDEDEMGDSEELRVEIVGMARDCGSISTDDEDASASPGVEDLTWLGVIEALPELDPIVRDVGVLKECPVMEFSTFVVNSLRPEVGDVLIVDVFKYSKLALVDFDLVLESPEGECTALLDGETLGGM